MKISTNSHPLSKPGVSLADYAFASAISSIRGLSRSNSSTFESKPTIETFHSHKTEALLATGHWHRIIHSPHHFLITYLLQVGQVNERPLSVLKHRDTIVIRGNNTGEYEKFKESVESIRQLYVNGIKQDTLDLFTDGKIRSFSLGRLFLKEDSLVNSRTSNPKDYIQLHYLTEDYLSSTLSALKIPHTQTMIKRKVTPHSGKTEDINIRKITICWQQTPHHTFLVPPRALPYEEPPGNLNVRFFEDREVGGNFALISKEGPVKIHRDILRLIGPEVFQAMLDSKMTEATRNEYDMTAWSKQAIELLIEYCYMGHHHVAEKLFSQQTLDKNVVFELVQIAHQYQLNGLFTCACNALSACATIEDINVIAALAEQYQDDYLKKLDQLIILAYALAICSQPTESQSSTKPFDQPQVDSP